MDLNEPEPEANIEGTFLKGEGKGEEKSEESFWLQCGSDTCGRREGGKEDAAE